VSTLDTVEARLAALEAQVAALLLGIEQLRRGMSAQSDAIRALLGRVAALEEAGRGHGAALEEQR
jgi:hypothetical protein